MSDNEEKEVIMPSHLQALKVILEESEIEFDEMENDRNETILTTEDDIQFVFDKNMKLKDIFR